MLLLFQVLARISRRPGQPRKRISRARQHWYAIFRYIDGIFIVGGLFALTVIVVRSDFIFILLPTGLSLFVTFVMARSFLSNLKALFFTTVVALVYFAGVTGWELLTHSGTESKTILVTTTLAVAVMLAPLAIGALRALDQRFHLRDDAVGKMVEAFTSALREEIDLDQIRERFLDVVQKTLQPQFASMWALAPAQDTPETASQRSRSAVVAPLPQHAAERKPDLPVAPLAAISYQDPIVGYILEHPGTVEIERLRIDSPVVQNLKAEGAELALPLVSQGELIALLALGPRMDGLEYTRADRNLLTTLVSQVAPSLRVGQLVRTQQAQVRERERIEQELRTAQVIQRTFLPKTVPAPAGWRIVPHYQPAREVGGDFYDFLPFEDGRLGIIIGDVTDKGIPAALVMTATRTMLRTASQQAASPGKVFARVNDLLSADIPESMFVTCFYAILDPASGYLRFANAGQDLPYLRHDDGGICELYATGMPLGLMPGSRYEEGETTLTPGDHLLFYSDGLVEAHNPQREMFGLPRLRELLQRHGDGTPPIVFLLHALAEFTGAGWEQEDDITLVAVQRAPHDNVHSHQSAATRVAAATTGEMVP
ncbi:MAG TPA: GAF domain-containing SpoIIE family protein phosphatase [Ktedonobacterales bacterium]|nr:GAF domain-containing SpoIIE family protein phosphatase [Ktedonobacterales bacterium]